MRLILLTTALTLPTLAFPALAHDPAANEPGAIASPAGSAEVAAFDILAAHVHRDGDNLTFHMTLADDAGSKIPPASGALGGAPVWSYLWPTSLDPEAVGFEAGTGILALAATSHPDFDDTPLYDENADGDFANDGSGWHAHWVVLMPEAACGEGALAVRDIPEGTTPKLPATWPGLPLFIDSPDARPVLAETEISLTIAAPTADALTYDGVTAALRVHDSVHAPLLCVTDVWDVASGELSLPGKVD